MLNMVFSSNRLTVSRMACTLLRLHSMTMPSVLALLTLPPAVVIISISMSSVNWPVIVVLINKSGEYKNEYLEPNLPKEPLTVIFNESAVTVSLLRLASIRRLTIDS